MAVQIEPLFDDINETDVFDFEIAEYLPALEKKLKDSGLSYRVERPENDTPEIFIDIPTESGKRVIRVMTIDECKMLLGSKFCEFRALQNFKGIYSEREKVIECSVLPIHGLDTGFVRRNARRIIERPVALNDPENPGVSITLGRISKELAAIDLYDGERISFRICGLDVTGKSPGELLTKYANSLFFQMEMLGRLPYALERYNVGRVKAKSRLKDGEVEFPSVSFEQGPMALYWYARGATQLPLLKFLAYYQCIEYFFPRLSRLAAHKKVQSLLKDPAFRATNDADIERVFRAIKLTSTGRLGDEKSQLVSVIKECLHPKEIVEFIEGEELRKGHLTSSKNGLSQHLVSIKNEDGVIATVANRIYEIRCKIVHTKNEADEDQVEVILPNSPDADLLAIDTDLVQFIAQKVLIYTSSRI